MDKLTNKLITLADAFITKLKGFQKIFLFIALVTVVISVIAILNNNPNLLSDFSIKYVILLLALGVPLTILQNTWRYKLSAALLEINIPWIKSLYVAVLTTIANLLPLPGGILMKIGSLRSHSASYKEAATVTIHTAYIWAACTIFITGAGFIGHDQIKIGFSLIFTGLIAIYISWNIIDGYQTKRAIKQSLFINHTFASLIYSLRLYLCLLALGVDIAFSQAAALPLAPIVAAVVVIVPGGLGIQEATAALLGTFIGLPPEKVFIAGLINRVFGLTGNGIVAVLFFLKSGLGTDSGSSA